MWVAKIEFSGDKALLGNMCKKYNLELMGYPLSITHKLESIQILTALFLFGDKKDIKEFTKAIIKSPRIKIIENRLNFLICQIKEFPKNSVAYNEKIIHIEPVLINKKGTETWTVGSWNKKELIDFLELVEKKHHGQLVSIKNKQINNFSIVSVNPSLTENQKNAIELAINNGYYDYPRKIKLEDLAEESKISYSTYHAHLRKAEQRLIPFLFSKNIKISEKI